MKSNKCARPECEIDIHPNPKNNGGKYCCNSCKLTGSHGPACKGKEKTITNTIVISHYKSSRFEDLMLFFPHDNIIIYDKSNKNYQSDEIKKIFTLENKGREGHTYISHILRNYNNLPFYTMFIKDDSDNHILSYPSFKEETDRVISGNIKFYQYRTSWKLGEPVQNKRVIVNGILHLHTFHSPNAIKDACEKLRIILPNTYSTEPGSHFLVHKDLILSRPIEFYENLRIWLLENEKNSIVLEHMWPIIFNCFVP